MINIYEYLLGKNKKLTMPKRPELGCSIEDIIKWIETFNIKRTTMAMELIDEIYYYVYKDSVEIGINVNTKFKNNKYIPLNYQVKINLSNENENLISSSKHYNFIKFNEVIEIAEKIMSAKHDKDKIIDIITNYKKYLYKND